MKKKFDFRSDRFYNTDHLWAKEDKFGQIIIGMDALGLDSLGELVYLSLPEVGTRVNKGKAMGSMEAAKMTGELYAPVSGVIVERNEAVLKIPLLANEDPFDGGWMVKIHPSNWDEESETMVSGDGLASWIEKEIKRFETQGNIS